MNFYPIMFILSAAMILGMVGCAGYLDESVSDEFAEQPLRNGMSCLYHSHKQEWGDVV